MAAAVFQRQATARLPCIGNSPVHTGENLSLGSGTGIGEHFADKNLRPEAYSVTLDGTGRRLRPASRTGRVGPMAMNILHRLPDKGVGDECAAGELRVTEIESGIQNSNLDPVP